MVVVRVPLLLQRYSDAEVEVSAGTARDALEAVFVRHPDLRARVLDDRGEIYPYLHLFVDGEQTRDLDAPLRAILEIVGAAAGG